MGLFPLNLVLFPGSARPLRIFEERYKLLITRCLEGDKTFGIVLLRSGIDEKGDAQHYLVGTVAKITDVKPLNDGEMLISIVGEHRFRIIDIVSKDPYVVANVDLLPEDVDSSVSKELIDNIQVTLDEYVRTLMGLQGGWLRHFSIMEDSWAMSYYIADSLVNSVDLKQQLLEIPNTSSRINAELDILSEDTKVLRRKLMSGGNQSFSLN